MDAHRGSFSFLTLHFYLAAVFFDDLLSDHHPQTGAVTFGGVEGLEQTLFGLGGHTHAAIDDADHQLPAIAVGLGGRRRAVIANVTGERKSTRLNSSHLGISYAVFCLK